jgi:hypothetical protein
METRRITRKWPEIKFLAELSFLAFFLSAFVGFPEFFETDATLRFLPYAKETPVLPWTAHRKQLKLTRRTHLLSIVAELHAFPTILPVLREAEKKKYFRFQNHQLFRTAKKHVLRPSA